MSIARKSDAGVAKLEKEIEELERQYQEEAKKAQVEGNDDKQVTEELHQTEEEAGAEAKTEDRRLKNSKEEEGSNEPTSKEESTYKKRYGDLRRHSQKVENELKDRIKKLEEVVSKSSNAPPTDPEKVREWAEKYPQVAAVIAAIAEEKTSEKMSDFEQLKTMQEEIARERFEAKIRKVHPDFDDIVGSDDFHDWAETQPKIVQDAVYDGSAEDGIWAITMYKKEKNIAVSSSEKGAAQIVKGKGTEAPNDNTKGRWSESKVRAMSDEDFEKFEKEILEAQRSGKFVYDISGAAR